MFAVLIPPKKVNAHITCRISRVMCLIFSFIYHSQHRKHPTIWRILFKGVLCEQNSYNLQSYRFRWTTISLHWVNCYIDSIFLCTILTKYILSNTFWDRSIGQHDSQDIDWASQQPFPLQNYNLMVMSLEMCPMCSGSFHPLQYCVPTNVHHTKPNLAAGHSPSNPHHTHTPKYLNAIGVHTHLTLRKMKVDHHWCIKLSNHINLLMRW